MVTLLSEDEIQEIYNESLQEIKTKRRKSIGNIILSNFNSKNEFYLKLKIELTKIKVSFYHSFNYLYHYLNINIEFKSKNNEFNTSNDSSRSKI